MRRISLCLLAAVMSAGLASTARAAEVEAVLPAETEYVMHMNFKQMLSSEIMKKYAMGQLKQALQGEDVKAMLDSFGIDPLTDIDEATVGFWGTTDEMDTVGVVKGKFDAKKMFNAIKNLPADAKDKVEMVTDTADGKEITLVKVTQDSGKPMFLTVADESTILFGTEKKLASAAVTAFNNKEKAKLNKDLTALVLKQDEKASMYFCAVTKGKFKDVPAGTFDGLQQMGINGEKMKESLDKMNTVSVTLNVGKEVKFSAVMGMQDADSAEDFNGTLGQLVGTVKSFLPLLAGQQPQAQALIADLTDEKTGLGVKAKDKDVTISLTISGTAIGNLAGSDE